MVAPGGASSRAAGRTRAEGTGPRASLQRRAAGPAGIRGRCCGRARSRSRNDATLGSFGRRHQLGERLRSHSGSGKRGRQQGTGEEPSHGAIVHPCGRGTNRVARSFGGSVVAPKWGTESSARPAIFRRRATVSVVPHRACRGIVAQNRCPPCDLPEVALPSACRSRHSVCGSDMKCSVQNGLLYERHATSWPARRRNWSGSIRWESPAMPASRRVPLRFRRVTCERGSGTPMQRPFYGQASSTSLKVLSVFERFHALQPRMPFDVLDFGCGCGRLLRFFESRNPEWRVRGADANSDLASWCSSSLPARRDPPQCGRWPFAAGERELRPDSTVLSVSTHLREDRADSMAARTRQAPETRGSAGRNRARPGRRRDDSLLRCAPVNVLIDPRRGRGTGQRAARAELCATFAYPDDIMTLANVGPEYGKSFVAEDYLRQAWNTAELEVCDVLPGGLRGWQEYLRALRRRASRRD